MVYNFYCINYNHHCSNNYIFRDSHLDTDAEWDWSYASSGSAGFLNAGQYALEARYDELGSDSTTWANETSIGTGITIAQEGRIKLARLFAELGFNEEVPYPDIATKAKAQEFIGLPMDKMKKDSKDKTTQERKAQVGSGDRSEKIRTYNFSDRRVTDHRIGFTAHKLMSMLDGALDELTDALMKAEEELQKT